MKIDHMEFLGIIFFFCLLGNGDLFPLDEVNREVLTEATKSFDELIKEGHAASPQELSK